MRDFVWFCIRIADTDPQIYMYGDKEEPAPSQQHLNNNDDNDQGMWHAIDSTSVKCNLCR